MSINLKLFLRNIFHDIFILSFIALFLFTILEISYIGLVSNYVNINIVLGTCIISSIILLLFDENKIVSDEVETNNKGLSVRGKTIKQQIVFSLIILIISLIGGYSVYYYANDLGVFAYILGIVTFLGIGTTAIHLDIK